MRRYRIVRPIGLSFVAIILGPPIGGLTTALAWFAYDSTLESSGQWAWLPMIALGGIFIGSALGLVPAAITVVASIVKSRVNSVSFVFVLIAAGLLSCLPAAWASSAPGPASFRNMLLFAPLGGVLAAWVVSVLARWAGLVKEMPTL